MSGASRTEATHRINAEEGWKREMGKKTVRNVVSTAKVLIAAAVATLAMAAPASAALGITSFTTEYVDPFGTPVTQAGAHPDLVTDLRFETVYDPREGYIRPTEQLKDLQLDLPPGFYGNPNVVTRCGVAHFEDALGTSCPVSSQVGFAETRLANEPGEYDYGFESAIYNLPPQDGDVATFGFMVEGILVRLGISVRTDGDYGLRTEILNANEGVGLYGSHVTIWGVPADPVHDPFRWDAYQSGNNSSNMAPAPLLTLPTQCDRSLTSTVRARSWIDPGTWTTATSTHPALEGCDRLLFDPTLNVEPEASTPDTPTAYDIDVVVPQEKGNPTLATPLLRKAVVSLPPGVAVSPASADGVVGCSNEQLALGTKQEPSCPSGSKIGTVSIETPVLPEPLEGEVILGTPKPGELFRLFLVARGSNVLLKIPGVAHPDPQTGQLTTVFDETPELPFEKLHLHLKGGSRAALVNPDTCGSHLATAEMTPSAGAIARPTSSFDVTGCKGGFSPKLDAGSRDPLAGAFSPFQLRVTRENGEQNLRTIDLTLPPGQLASLRGIPYCSDSTLASISTEEGAAAGEIASPSCPVGSKVGTVLVGAGAGSTPLYVSGSAYLAGPYKGAPLSLAFVTPALAGPFDLGNVVVRSALRVDPVTAQVRAVSDPLPTILHGVPLDLKDIRVSLDRPNFTINPTGCDAMRVDGSVTSANGAVAVVGNRYQVGDCADLGFKPKLSLKLSGATHRSAHPKLRAVLKARKGDANIGKAVVTLPKTEFLENAHIRTVCTRVQYAADNCPKDSVYGYAKAWSPLLDQPLQGPVYLRSSNHPLPDLVASLDGQIQIDLAGRIDSVHQRIRNTFWAVPDAPVSKFVLTMQGGKKGLLVNNTELCKAKPRASAVFTGHNGKNSSSNPLVKADCGGKSAQRHTRHQR